MVLMRHHVFGLQTTSRLLLPLISAGQLTWSGVDLFFVLSGFLIGGILLDAKHSPHYFKTFYIRRAYRIFPLYFLVTGLVLLIRQFFPLALHEHPLSTMPGMAYLTLTQNLWVSHTGIHVLAPTWSLCVEEQFYLTIPLIIRFLTRRQLVVTLVSVVVAVPLLRVLLYPLPHGDLLCFGATPCRADALCLGVLSAIVVRDSTLWSLLVTQRIWLRGVLVVLCVGVIYLTWQRYTPFTPPMNTFGLSWMAFFYAVGLLAVVTSSGGIISETLRNKTLVGLGKLAYCAYLIHLPLRDIGRQVFAAFFTSSPNVNWFAGGMLGLTVTLIIASVSWKFFEKPLWRLGHRFEY
jgi:peptidoglycan/LPS O-acetylase OafA/YrhL